MAGEEEERRDMRSHSRARYGLGASMHLHRELPTLLDETVPDGILHVLHSCGTREKST